MFLTLFSIGLFSIGLPLSEAFRREKDSVDSVEAARNKVLEFCKRKLDHDADAAEEATQETFRRVWAARDKWKEVQNLQALLFGFAKNVCLEMQRKKAKQRVSILVLEDPEAKRLTEDAAKKEFKRLTEDAAKKELLQEIKAILSEFPDRDVQILMMTSVQQHTQEEVAAHLGITRDLVNRRLGLVRKRVKEQLEKDRSKARNE